MEQNLTYLSYAINCPCCQHEFRFAVGVTGAVVVEGAGEQVTDVEHTDVHPMTAKAKKIPFSRKARK